MKERLFKHGIAVIAIAVLAFFAVASTVTSASADNDPPAATGSFPEVGIWNVTGQDSGGNWTADMVIEETNANSFSGYFEWRGAGNSGGREYFRGSFDPRTRKVSMQGYRLENDRGIGMGSYEATLNRDGNAMRSGPGGGFVWEARVQNNPPSVWAEPFPEIGIWSVTGRDSGGNWTADMVIEEIDAGRFSGYFEWRGANNSGGREYFRGVYDPQTRKVSMQGYRLENDRGIGMGSYEATLNRDGNAFESGTWAGGGVWEARVQS